MEFVSREVLLNEMNESLKGMLIKYDLDDIGIFEEEGEGNLFHLGYTIRKNDTIHMIHIPFMKNGNGDLAPTDESWVIENADGDSRGYQTLEEVFQHLEIN